MDQFLSKIEAHRGSCGPNLEQALLAVLPELDFSSEPAWEAVHLVLSAANSKSPKIAELIMLQLDKFSEPETALGRYNAFLAYRSAGGSLTRTRLEAEKRLQAELTPRWVDLVISAYQGAPENIISVLEGHLAENKGFTWEDLRRRLPYLFRALGEHFNRGIIQLIRAVPRHGDQLKLAQYVKMAFGLDALSEVNKPASIHFNEVSSAATRQTRRRSTFEKLDEVFGHVITPAFLTMKALRTSDVREADR